MRRYNKPKRVRCAICNEMVDRSACNQTYAIITIVKDTDETGTKKTRQYLCPDHSPDLEVWLARAANIFFKIFEEE